MLSSAAVFFSFLLIASVTSKSFVKLSTISDDRAYKLSVEERVTVISSDPQNLLENIVVTLDDSNITATAFELSQLGTNGQQIKFLSNPLKNDYVSFKFTNTAANQATLTGYVIIENSSLNISTIPKDLSPSITIGSAGQNLIFAPSVIGKTAIAKNVKGKQLIGYTGIPDDVSKIMFFNSSLFDVDSYDVVELPSGFFHFVSSDPQTSFSVSMGDRISQTITSLTSSGVFMSEGFPSGYAAPNVQYTLINPSNDNVVANMKPFLNSLIDPAYTTNITIGTSADSYQFDCTSKFDTTVNSNRITNMILINTTGPYSIQYTLKQKVLLETSTKFSTSIQFIGIVATATLMRL